MRIYTLFLGLCTPHDIWDWSTLTRADSLKGFRSGYGRSKLRPGVYIFTNNEGPAMFMDVYVIGRTADGARGLAKLIDPDSRIARYAGSEGH